MARPTASRSTSRPRDRIDRLEHDAKERVVELKLIWRRELTGERLFEVGGVWDATDGCWLDTTPRFCRFFDVSEAQLESAIAIGKWIAARAKNEKRVAEIVLEGGRGSGKSVEGVVAVFTIALAFPGARCFLIPTATTRRDELEVIVRDLIPAKWRTWTERDLTYSLPNGSTVRYLGADDEDMLRQGGYEVALANEMQLFRDSAFSTIAAGIRNVSQRPEGLLIGAMNPSTKFKGEWTEDHLDKIDGGYINALHFKLDPEKNQFIGKNVFDDVDAIIRSVRPDLADADAKGIRRRLLDLAAPAFLPWPSTREAKRDDGTLAFGHIGRPPDLAPPEKRWRNVTAEITEKRLGRRYPLIVGADFQKRPGCCAVAKELWQRPDGRIVYRALRYLGGEPTDNEEELGRRIDAYAASRDIEARDVLVIADSSGKYQDGPHRPGAKPSIAILEEFFFRVEPVVRARDPRSTSGAGRNPDVPDNLAQFFDVCVANRFLVEPTEEWLVECLRRCKTKKRGGSLRLDDSKPGYSHAIDCIRYVVHWFEPKRGLEVAPPSRTSGRQTLGRRM